MEHRHDHARTQQACPWFHHRYPLLLLRMRDVGKSKAEVAAERINTRISGANVTPHHCRIEDKPADWYQQFTVIILGLDSLEARRYMNSVVCSFLGAPAGAAWQAAPVTLVAACKLRRRCLWESMHLTGLDAAPRRHR